TLVHLIVYLFEIIPCLRSTDVGNFFIKKEVVKMEAQNNSGSDPESYRKKDSLKVDKHFYHFNLI
ncbi:hypothetical protein K9859_13305, partial [Lactococcus lactis]|nr:hypothetical protein [Lactococcus lactis]